MKTSVLWNQIGGTHKSTCHCFQLPCECAIATGYVCLKLAGLKRRATVYVAWTDQSIMHYWL